MYIRLKKRKITDKWFNFGAQITYDCVLVESYRDPDGNVRQRFLKHLGTIRDKHLMLPHTLRSFYEDIEKELSAYGLESEKILKLTTRLEKNFGPKPSPEVAEEYVRKAWAEIQG